MARQQPAVRGGASGAWQVFALVAAVGTAAAWWCWAQGYTLYYGDAEAHLNIARRICSASCSAPGNLRTDSGK